MTEPIAPSTTSDSNSSRQPTQPVRSKRVLACVLCQQRKIKCDRRYPCGHCIKSQSQCIPSTLAPRRRRRQHPEGQLLERIRKYEELLRQNQIKFDPFVRDESAGKESPGDEDGDEYEDKQMDPVGDGSSPSTISRADTAGEARNVWLAMYQGVTDPDTPHNEVDEKRVKMAWDQLYRDGDHLLFGSHTTAVDLAPFHPDTVQIFRLWQTFLDNVNPLIRVVHAPTLQTSIIEAAGDVTKITPSLEALMFSIYCMAVLSLEADDCMQTFSLPKEALLVKYRFGCQQALSNCKFLRSEDREILTALYLYLVAVQPCTIPRSLSPMLGVSIRLAYRMGIHDEERLSKCSPFEAEMRRRLWWSLIIFDARMSEMSEARHTTLSPVWDCKPPLNVNDTELWPEMRDPPTASGKPSEAVFVAAQSELYDFLRRTNFFVDLKHPVLKSLAGNTGHNTGSTDSELDTLERLMQDKHLSKCDSGIPIHHMTVQAIRSYLARQKLVELLSKRSGTTDGAPSDANQDLAMSYALTMLRSDTEIVTFPLIKGYMWLMEFHFPFVAYIQVLYNLRRRPMHPLADEAWLVMSENAQGRFHAVRQVDEPLFDMFSQTVMQAWQVRKDQGEEPPMAAPRIVTLIEEIRARFRAAKLELKDSGGSSGTTQTNELPSMDMDLDWGDFPLPPAVSTGLKGFSSFEGQPFVRGLDPFAQQAYEAPSDMLGADQLDWSAMDLNEQLGNVAAPPNDAPQGFL